MGKKEERGKQLRQTARSVVSVGLAVSLLCGTATPAFALMELTAKNPAEENQRLLEQIERLLRDTGKTAEEKLRELQSLGVVSEEAKLPDQKPESGGQGAAPELEEIGSSVEGLVTQGTILLDGEEWTLDRVRRMLAEPDVDLSRTVDIDGIQVTLENLKTMVEIEDAIQAFADSFLSPEELPERQRAEYDSILQQLRTTGIELTLEDGAYSAEELAAMSGAAGGVSVLAAGTSYNHSARLKVSASLVKTNNGANASFTVTQPKLDYATSFTYRTVDGSALAGVNYQSVPETTVTFAPGETSKTITVTGKTDNTNRWNGDISYAIELYNAQNILFDNGYDANTVQVDIQKSSTFAANVTEGGETFLIANSKEGSVDGGGSSKFFNPAPTQPYGIVINPLSLSTELKQAISDGIATHLVFAHDPAFHEPYVTTNITFKVDDQILGQMTQGPGGQSSIIRGAMRLTDEMKTRLRNASAVSGEATVTHSPDNTEFYNQYIRGLYFVDWENPTIVDVKVPDGTYYPGQKIPVTVTFSEPVKSDSDPTNQIRYIVNGTTLSDGTPATLSTRRTLYYPVKDKDAANVTITTIRSVKDAVGKWMSPDDSTNRPFTGAKLVTSRQNTFLSVSCETPVLEADGGDAVVQIKLDTELSDWVMQPDALDNIKLSADGGATFLDVDWLRISGVAQEDTLAGTVTLPRNLSDQPAVTRVELFLKGSDGKFSPVLGQGKYVDLTVSVGTFAEAIAFDEESYPAENVIYFNKPPRLTCTVTPPLESLQPQRKIVWASSDPAVASIDENGQVTAFKEGQVSFTASVDGAGTTLTAQTPVFEVVDGGEPFLQIPGSVTTSVYTDTTVSWNTNVTYKLDKKGQVARYSVTFYEGLVTEDQLADAQSVWETTVDGVDGDGVFINSVVIPGDLLKEISEDAIPAYTVAVSCDHPDYPGQTLLTLAPIITQAKPVVPRFETLDTYFITDSDESIQDGKKTISWRFENGDTTNGVTYSYTVVKNNQQLLSDSGTALSETGSLELPIDQVGADSLRDIYIVTMQARNPQDTVDSSDSFVLYVYKSGALDIVVDGQKTDGLLMDNSQNPVVNQTTTENVEKVREEANLQSTVGINSGDYQWSSVDDQIAWESSDNNAANLNFQQGGVYNDIREYDYSTFRPSSEFMLVGQNDGETTITATHAKTGEQTTLDVTVKTLQDKLYVFNCFPRRETELTYTNGAGDEKTLKTNAQGEIAIYEEKGIASDVTLKSGAGDDLYLGTIYREKLISSEADPSRLELYPVNAFSLRPASRVSLFLLEESGQPYEGDLTISGGVYKNGKLCEETMIVGSPVELREDGNLVITMDPTKFWTDSHDEELSAADQLDYVFIARTPGDAYYPLYIKVDGAVSQEDSVAFTTSALMVTKVPEDEREKPFIATQTAQYKKPGQVASPVLNYSEIIGVSDYFPEMDLTTTVLWWGEDAATAAEGQYDVYLTDEHNNRLQGQRTSDVTRYPFSDIAVSENVYAFRDGLDLGTGDTMRPKMKLIGRDGTTLLVRDTAFQMMNAVGLPDLESDPGLNGALDDMFDDDGYGTDTSSPNYNQGGEMAAPGTMNLLSKLNIESSALTMALYPTANPGVWQFLVTAGFDGMGDSKSENKVMIDQAADKTSFLPGPMDIYKVISGTYVKDTVKDLTQALKSGTGNEKAYGAKLGGFYEGIVTWNAEKGQWEFKTRSGGFTYGAAAGYTWSVNTMVGPIPITASASVGGGLEMDHKILMTTHGSGATARDFQNLLVTMRINAYTKAFVGIGFDITVLALKFGVFGQVDLTNYNAFLNFMDENGKVHDINGQRTSLSGQTGIEFYLKILFIKYRKILASASFNIGTWETGKWNEIQDWTEKANFPSDFGGYQSRTLDAQAMMMALAALPEFETLAEGMYAEDRDYLAMAERVWGDSGISLFSLDEENKLKNLQSNAYPYSAPLVTGDGELVVFLSDGDSADLNQTQVQFTTMQPDGTYGVPQRVDPDAQYPDSNLSLAGSKSFAVAAWQRQNATLELEAGQEANTDDLNAMMKATEICVGLYKNGRWAVEQLTDNSVTDMAPVVATNGSRAVVVWRRMASTTTQDAAFMNFDAQNALLYRIYDGQKWSEEQVLYNGTMGAVKGLNAAMDQAGNTVVTYTVDTASYIGQEAPEVQLTAEEGGSKTFEIAYAVISADEGRAGATVRLTNDSNLDENPQITTVTLDGEERFLLGWHSQSLDADAGTEVSDIQMRVVNPDGSLYGNFVDNLRQVQNGGGVSIGNAFKFSKAKGVQDLNNLSLIWVSPTAEYREDEAEKAAFDADELFAVKFGQDAGGRVYLSAPLPVISAGENTKVDHFDAYISGEELKAVLLSSEYDMEDPGRRVNIALENGASIALTEPISAMQTATARYQNALELRDVPILDYADVRHGNSLPIQFTLTNTGKDVLTGVSIKIEGKEAKTTEFNSLNLAPNNSVTLTVYQYLEEEGELISDLRYTVKPTFGTDQSVAALTGDIRLQIPDVGISTLETYLEMNGDRMMQMKLYNRSDIELDLLKDRGYSVKIGFYTDSTCNTPADGVRFLDYGDAALLSNEPVFTVDPSKMNLLDHGALICRFAYTLPDTGFQDGDITLYARAWIEDSEGNEISEAYQANNAGSIIFTDPVRRNGGQQFLLTPTLGYDEASGVSTASVTVSNLAFAETEKTGNLIVSLLDESGNVLETLQTLQGPDSLIALGKEASQTLEFTFGQKGTSLLCSYVQVSEEEADNTLSALTIDGVPLQFDKDTETYSFDVQNLLAAKIQAVASNPGATVQINQEAGQTGSAAGAVPLMLGQDVPETNTITITVTPVAGAPKTYTVTLQALRISNSNVNLSAPEWTRQSGKVPVDVMLEAFDGMPQSVKVKVDNENWGAPGNWLGGSQGTVMAALPDKEGVHTVQVSISDTLGFWTTGELQIGLDQTAPVMEESDVAFEETDLPLFKALSLIPSETDGVTDKQLRVIVHASDALSGIERVTATAGDRVYTAEPVEGQADTYSIMITYGFRGPLVITAYDRAGNQTEVSRYVNVDDEMPTGDVLTGGAVTTQTSATLYGTVTMDDSLLVECGIEYYNAAEEVPNWVRLPLLDLTQKSAFSVRAVGLEPNTAYVYRVYARNLANQMHYGTSNTFTTSACACTVSDVEVTTPLTIEMDAREAQKLVELRAGSSFAHNGCTSHEGMAAAPQAVYTYEVVSGPATVEGSQLCVTGTGIVRVKVTAVYALDDTTEAAGSAYVNFTVTQKSQPSATGLSYTQPSGAVPGDIPVTVLGVNLGEADEIIVTASHADETVRTAAEPDAAGNYVAVLSGLANGSAEESKAYALAVEIDGVPQVLAGAQPTLVLPRAAHSGSAILDFYVEGQLGAAEIGDDAIRIVMPYQTDLTAFPLDARASWTVSPGAAVTHDEPRMEDGALTAAYTVTAENGAAQTYTLRLELQPAPVIAELPFEDVTLETNGGFVSGEIVGEHLENAASITVSLYNADGMEVSRARAVSDPDTGAVTISLPVPENSSEEEPAVYTIGYTIDGVETLTDKTVTVPKKAAAGCELLTFQVEGAVSTEVNAITRQITVTMPYDYPSDTVVPQFTCSAYASVTDLSGGIPVDGTAELTITAENGAAEKTYEIAVVRQATPEVYLMDFANPGNLGGRTLIHVDGVNLANAREIRIEAAATDDPDCVVTAVAQTNGANGFTALLNLPQNYLIHADRVFILTAFVDGVEQTSLDVTQKDIVQPQNNNRILAFTVEGSAAEAEIDEGDGTDSGVITVTMPYNADLTALAPVITVPEGASVAPGSGAAVDLSNPVEYKVSTAGHPDRTYTVQAVRESAPRVTGLEFTPFQTSTAGTLTIRILGENLDHMQDSMQITARAEGCEDVAAQAVRQEDGTYLAVLEIPANTDPLNPVVWTLVVAVDGTEQVVDANTVTVPQQLAIVSFEIAGQRSSTITGTAILVEMPAGTDLTKLVPVITASPGAQVSLPSGVETSFEKPVQITVSMDGNEVTYTVTVRRQSGGGGGGGGGAAAAEEYILQASAGQHGSISPSGALKVPENASQTYAITPDDGYQIADVLVDGESVGAVSSYTFRDIAGAHTIQAFFVPEGTQGLLPFVDVAADDWFYHDVVAAYHGGLLNGTDAVHFSPDGAMTRAMLFTVLARMDGQKTEGGKTWYSAALQWVVSEGISDGSNPNGKLTREQLATILHRYAGHPKAGADLAAFSDAGEVSGYAEEAVKWAVGAGLITGMGDGTLRPQGGATRAQVAAILVRFQENREGN